LTLNAAIYSLEWKKSVRALEGIVYEQPHYNTKTLTTS